MPAHRAARRTRRTRAAALGTLTLLGVLGPGAGMALAAGPDKDCIDFDTQDEAQRLLDSTSGDPHRLDGDGNGIACESLDSRGGSVSEELGLGSDDESSSSSSGSSSSSSSAVSSSTSSSGSSGSSGSSTRTSDRDCADFSSQAEAQDVLDDDPSDPERLDADDDGIACESYDYGDDSDSEDDGDDTQVRPAATEHTETRTNDYPVGGVDAGDGSAPSDGADALTYALLSSAAVAGAVAVRHARPGRHRRV